jgi:hypothetical protein
MASSSPLHRGDDDDDDDVNAEGCEVGDGARDRRSGNIILAANERRDEDLSFKLASGLSAPIQSVRLPRYIRTREKNTHTQEHHERARARIKLLALHPRPSSPIDALLSPPRSSTPNIALPLYDTDRNTQNNHVQVDHRTRRNRRIGIGIRPGSQVSEKGRYTSRKCKHND